MQVRAEVTKDRHKRFAYITAHGLSRLKPFEDRRGGAKQR
jgi:hypothetical protein